MATREQAEGEQGGMSRGTGVSPELGGDLLCRRCRYNMRGLSIRGVCPECGLPVRATLLAVVDPRAKELQPLWFPRATAVGLVVWTHGAVASGLFVMVARLHAVGIVRYESRDAGEWAALCAGASAVGALSLVAPHRGLSVGQRMVALGGVGMLAGAAYLMWRVLVLLDPQATIGAFADRPPMERVAWKLCADVAIACALLLLRPNARLLAARSLLMRTGMVNRQTLASLAAVAGVCVAGDLLMLGASALWGMRAWEGVTSVLGLTGQIFALVGGALLFLGLIGAAVDAWRLLPVVLERPLQLEDLLSKEDRA